MEDRSQSSLEAPQRVACIVGRPGMCSDDGRALTYYYEVQTNERGGRGYYSDPHGCFNTEEQARAWCVERGYEPTGRAIL